MPGELPLVLLALIADRSQSGYELLGELERRFGPAYGRHPAASIPALSALRVEQLVEQEPAAEGRIQRHGGRTPHAHRPARRARQDRGPDERVRSTPDASLQPTLARFAAGSASSAVVSTAPPSSASSTPPPRRSPTWRSAMNSDSSSNSSHGVTPSSTRSRARGRRRSLLIMILAFIPSPFLVMATNNDPSLAGLIPVGIACVVGISYSWTKWQRRPEDSQSVAFVGLDRKRTVGDLSLHAARQPDRRPRRADHRRVHPPPPAPKRRSGRRHDRGASPRRPSLSSWRAATASARGCPRRSSSWPAAPSRSTAGSSTAPAWSSTEAGPDPTQRRRPRPSAPPSTPSIPRHRSQRPV